MATTSPKTARPEDETAALPEGQPLKLELEDEIEGIPAEELGDDLEVDSTLGFHLDGIANRERSLPIRQGDLTRMLLAEPELTEGEQSRLAAFGTILGATFHSEFFALQHRLKELYAPLDPDTEYVTLKDHTQQRSEHSDEDFLAALETMLDRANYRPLDLQVIREAIAAPNELGLTYVPDFSLFEHLRFYVRGFIQITRECRSTRTRFLKRTVVLDAYQRMVVALKFKPTSKLGPNVRSDVLYLRMFKDVPHVDMEMHLPEQGTKVRMRWIDKVQIASPLAIGIPTLAIKVFFASLISPVAVGGLLLGPISAGVNSFFGFHRARQNHLYAMIHKLYYLTLANNASLLARLVDAAEDEEYKEAVLAYYFLWRGTGSDEPWTPAALDLHIEDYLKKKTGVEIDFEVTDALRKLFRLGLASYDAKGGLKATPIDRALTNLDRRWDDTFRYPDRDHRGVRGSAPERC
jgi:hypothetical protein